METHKVLDTNLLIDGKTGLTTVLNVIEYPKSIQKDNEIIWPTRDDYVVAIEIMVALLDSGKPIPAVDVLVAAMCLNRKLTLVTKDRHFSYVKLVREEFSLEFPKQESKKKGGIR